MTAQGADCLGDRVVNAVAEPPPVAEDASIELDKRIDAAVERVVSGHATMRIPVHRTDVDVVLRDCQAMIRCLATELAAAKKERDAVQQEWDEAVALVKKERAAAKAEIESLREALAEHDLWDTPTNGVTPPSASHGDEVLREFVAQIDADPSPSKGGRAMRELCRRALPLLVLVLIAACSSSPTWSPPVAPDLDTAGPPVPDAQITEATFTAPLKAMFAPLAAPFVTQHVRMPGAIRIETGDTPCEYDYELPRPSVSVEWREPQVGQVVAADFMSCGIAAPGWPQCLICEIRDVYDTAHFSADVLGLPGCWLHVDLAHAFAVWPGSDEGNWAARLPGDEGRVRVRFTPTADLLGKTVVLQSVVFTPRDVVRAGIVLGPALLVCVGEPR